MRVCTYARVSTLEQQKGNNIDSQVSEIREYCRKNNYTITGEFIDDGVSGELLERPGLDQLRDAIKLQVCDGVVILHPDRLSRDQLHQFLLIDEFEKARIKLYFVNLPGYSEGSEETKIVNKSVFAMVSQLEKLRIKERTRRGKLEKIRKGVVIASKAPYGYRYIERGIDTPSRFELIPKEAECVRQIFNLALKGKTQREITEWLNTSEYKPRKSNVWQRSTVSKILNNETYTGIWYYNKHENCIPQWTKIIHKTKLRSSNKLKDKSEWMAVLLPPELIIVSKTEFDAVQRFQQLNRTSAKQNTSYPYLLRKLIYCYDCSQMMTPQFVHDRPYYRCNGCRCSVSAKKVEKMLFAVIQSLLKDPQKFVSEGKLFRTHTKDTKAKYEELQKQLTFLEGKKDRIRYSFNAGYTNQQEYDKDMRGWKDERKQVEQEMEKLQAEPNKTFITDDYAKLLMKLRNEIDTMKDKQKINVCQLFIRRATYNKSTRNLKTILRLPENELALMESLHTTSL